MTYDPRDDEDEFEEDDYHQYVGKYTKWIDSSPDLQSLLYDMGLLPETISTMRDANMMAVIVEASFIGVKR